MIKQKILIALSVVAILIVHNLVTSLLRPRDAVKTVDKILTYWKTGDNYKALPYWDDRESSPPIFGVTDYTIKETKMGKERGKHTAQITASIEFEESNILRSGKDWIFDLTKTAGGWKVISLQRADGRPPNID